MWSESVWSFPSLFNGMVKSCNWLVIFIWQSAVIIFEFEISEVLNLGVGRVAGLYLIWAISEWFDRVLDLGS